MSKYTKQQLNAISRYSANLSLELWRNAYHLLSDNEDKKVYCEIDKKYKYTEWKKKAFVKYLREKYGNDQARKIK